VRFRPRRTSSVLRAAAAIVAGSSLLVACTLSDRDEERSTIPRETGVRVEVYAGVPAPQRKRPRGVANAALCRSGLRSCPGILELEPSRTYYYVFPSAPRLTAEHFVLAETRQDFDSGTGEPVVLLRLNPEGVTTFRDLTRRLARGGRASVTQFAIVVDGELISAPAFDPRVHPDGLDASSGIQINGLASLEEARALAQVLKLSGDRASAAEMEH
jgi:preprotein translocase subunit SecD